MRFFSSCGCVHTTIWMHHMYTNKTQKKLDRNYTRMLCAIFHKPWKQHPTKQQLYGHLLPISQTIQVRHAGHCWRNKDKLISDIISWTPVHGCTSVGQPARTYLYQLCMDTGCNPEDLPEAVDDRDGW